MNQSNEHLSIRVILSVISRIAYRLSFKEQSGDIDCLIILEVAETEPRPCETQPRELRRIITRLAINEQNLRCVSFHLDFNAGIRPGCRQVAISVRYVDFKHAHVSLKELTAFFNIERYECP